MTDPRAITAYEGIGAEYTTYKYDSSIVFDDTKPRGSASVDLAVTFTPPRTGGLAPDAPRVECRLEVVESDGFCNVQTDGYTHLPGGNGATLTVGSRIVGALGPSSAKGYIRTAVSTEALAADGEIVDPTDTTSVVVDL
ncbi:MAG: hypothetical protein ACTHMP_26380 [Thermomicrobiales bacterium]